ncbi:hypothetical protein LEN26_017099 [Aphanomyces euteiches]|nr:hypothetical protein LEN26_017099 [Aphanomyces euteiches]KAH9114077.1 hypothetical protein AeMF1_011783 [Aphanomyces euteiches]KAH9189893.1 hypothetical protein AeNC1_008127 [Aphanomyces euteiches]
MGTDITSNSEHVLTSIKIYFPVFLGAVVLYELVRQQGSFQRLYACRNRAATWTNPLVAKESFGFGQWIVPAFRISDDEIFDVCGLDAVVHLRFIRLGLKVAGCGILLSTVLFPVYATAQWTSLDVDILDSISLNILGANDHRFWAAVSAMAVISAYTMQLLRSEYKAFISRRHQFLSKYDVQQYSIVIRDVPKQLQTQDNLTTYLDILFPDSVHAVAVVIECSQLEKLVAKRERYRNKLERALVQCHTSGQRPLHLVKSRGTTVDAISYFGHKLDQLNLRIPIEIDTIETQQRSLCDLMAQFTFDNPSYASENGKILLVALERLKIHWRGIAKPSQLMRCTAFVTFRTLLSAHMAQQLLQTSKPSQMLISAAPPAHHILWENLGMSIHVRRTLQLVTRYVTIALVVFWTIPTTIVTSFSSVTTLKKLIPNLDNAFAAHPWLENLVLQLAPLGLVVMTALAPVVFMLISRREGHESEPHVQMSLFKKLGYFQFIQIFAVSVIVGSVFDSLAAVLQNPVNLITMLAKAIPAQAANFMSFLVVKSGLNLALELWRVGPVLLGVVYSVCAPRLTKRERQSPWCGMHPPSEQGALRHSQVLPDYVLAMLLTLTFCPMSPLLCYFAAVYFALSELVYRRQLLFVYDPELKSTGLLWHPLYNFVVCALIVAQLTLLGVLILKQAPGPIVAAALLPFFTLLAHFHILQLYPRTSMYLPLLDCVRIDTARRQSDIPFSKQTYVQPALLSRPPLEPQVDESINVTRANLTAQEHSITDMSVYLLSD